MDSYQPERSKDGKTADVGHAKLEEGEGDDDEIKDVPTLLWIKLNPIDLNDVKHHKNL